MHGLKWCDDAPFENLKAVVTQSKLFELMLLVEWLPMASVKCLVDETFENFIADSSSWPIWRMKR